MKGWGCDGSFIYDQSKPGQKQHAGDRRGNADLYAVSDTTITQTGRAIEGFLLLLISFLLLNLLIGGAMADTTEPCSDVCGGVADESLAESSQRPWSAGGGGH